MSAFAEIFGPPAPPATRLGNHRLLSPNAGVHVSPLQLGAMSVGDQWSDAGMGVMDKEASFKLLDAYYDNGGNFIDTANNYQDESSEQFVGEWAEQRGIRDQLSSPPRYSGFSDFTINTIADSSQKTFYGGNSSKSMHLSVDASLKKLRTTYIDLLYVHWWDYQTSVKEVMDNLHNLVVQGRVLYLGVSDTPAWIVAKANQYARDHGKTPFVVYQGLWNVMERSFERDVIPMARAEGMALAPFNVLAGGKLRTDAEEQRRHEKRVSAALEKVAGEVGASTITAVAIAYVMQKVPYVFPIIGGRKVEHLLSNIEALEIALTDEHIATWRVLFHLTLDSPQRYSAMDQNTLNGS
ncbi:Aldo keto reductase [Infundibulicybe gibba]|nr:Aldo keto reductase [Infundibulicybe gibba]